ncbi:MAG: winged helix-turn-helix domain-containing protein [Bacteroides sp.]|nr:winged helix-turn-helix domain-containing protein [Roseburia sp.]MCM1346105.1 winged helix-turn-helix domain-containing protein [Bacteroides sp.]MCM1420740.1 winged helix-turn-helix domain-containing protein [Bacteroides sp.]
MDKGTIGTNAGKLWRLMDENHDRRHWSYERLIQDSGLSEPDFYAAIGWLARENKIELNTDKESGENTLYLNVCYYF